MSHLALDVSLSALSELLGDWSSLLEELLRALTRVFKTNHFPLMVEMCQLFLPGGKRLTHTSSPLESFMVLKLFPFADLDSLEVYKQKLEGDERSLAASRSLEALICYQLMYKSWWRCGRVKPSSGHRAAVENGDAAHQRELGDDEGFLCEEFWNVLLSEPHAAYQSTQRALEDIQGRVAGMVQQHRGLQVESGDLMEEQNAAEGQRDLETR